MKPDGKSVVTNIRFLLAATFLALLAACSGVTPYKVSSALPTTAAAVAEVAYRLSVNDKVKVTVFNEESLSGEFIVGAGNTISFPLVGAVEATGLTAEELGSAITTKLSDGYLHDPKVAVEIQTFKPVYVLGEVNHPGKFDFVQGMTVLQAIASAEGFSYRANKNVVLIKHPGASTEVAVEITPDLRVLPGDTIRVAERYF